MVPTLLIRWVRRLRKLIGAKSNKYVAIAVVYDDPTDGPSGPMIKTAFWQTQNSLYVRSGGMLFEERCK